MLIDRQKAIMLVEIAFKIKEHLNINIGYISNSIIALGPGCEFIIREPISEEDELQLLYIKDLILEQHGDVVQHWVEDVQHDHKCEELFQKIDDAVLDGKITFDPGITRTIDGVEINITRRELPNAVLFEMPSISDSQYVSGPNNLCPYSVIYKMAESNERFLAVKNIIDEMWPSDKMEFLKSEIKKHREPVKVETAMQKVLKWFAKLMKKNLW